MKRLAIFGGVCALVAVLLAVLLVAENPGPFGIFGTAELLLSLAWIAFVLNGCFAAALLFFEIAVRLVGIRRFDEVSDAYWLSGLVTANVAWVCINYLPLLQVWETSWRFYLSWILLAHAGMLAIGALLLFTAGMLLGARRRANRAAVLSFVVAVALLSSSVVWSRAAARQHRVYDLEDVIAAASMVPKSAPTVAVPEGSPSPASGSGGSAQPGDDRDPVIVLAIDGADWQVVTPLVRAGLLPHFAELVRQGSIAYLDNDDESFTWRIWPTIFGGGGVEEHGVYGPVKFVLPATGVEIPNLLYNQPENNSFYGISGLFGLVPSLGLWQEAPNDPATPLVWDVASDYQRRVVVAQVFGNLPFARPVYPINGAMITFAGPYSGPQASPAELLPVAESLQQGGTHEELLDWTESVADLTIDLFAEFDIDLGVYYTHTLDGIAHDDWDFNSRGSWWLRPPPTASDQQAWEQFVLANMDEAIFRGYEVIDRVVGRFLTAFPNATFVLCSDHGWSYTPFLHKGSPDGLLIVKGEGIRQGEILPAARTRDISPTVAAMLSIPQSTQLEGSVLEAAFVVPKALTYVDSYGEPRRVQSGDAVDPQLLERLRALGYIR